MQIIQKLLLLTSLIIYQISYGSFSIVIDPSQNNRTIGSEYEKNITLACAEAIRTYCYNNVLDITIEVTRERGETVEPLQIATFSNTVHPNLHIALHCVAKPVPELWIYYNQWNYTDTHQKQSNTISLIPAHQTYLYTYNTSKHYARTVYKFLEAYAFSEFTIITHKPIGCPCKPLFGLTAPSIVIELGIAHDAHLSLYTDMLTHLITNLTTAAESSL